MIITMTEIYVALFVLFLGVNEAYRLNNDVRERRSQSQAIAEQIYSQDLLAPFFSRRQHSDSGLLSKRSKGSSKPWLSNFGQMRDFGKTKTGKQGCAERSKITYKSPTVATLDVRFPAVHTTKDDTYLCTGFKIPFENNESFIVKFTPHADMEQTHHMLVYGCPELQSDKTYWNCWQPCWGKQTLYAWARNAPAMSLPKDVGYSIGGDSRIRYIAVQMHFAKAFKEPSCAGVSADITTLPQKNYAGIFLLGSPRIYLPPHSVNVPSTVACVNRIADPLHVFAFRTHAHTLANVITGYRFRNQDYKMVGKGNPKWPQSFYPRVGGEIVLTKGDVLAAQCVYNNTRNITVTDGAGGSDEMCNLYMMFYTSNKDTLKQSLECWGVPQGYKESDIKLPANSLEMPPYPGFAGKDSIDAIAEGRAERPPVPAEHVHHHHGIGNDEAEEGREEEEEEEREDPEPEEPVAGFLSDEELEEKLKQLKKLLDKNVSLSRSHGMPEYQGLQADLSYPQLQDGYSIGAVGGLVADKDGNVYVFHRAERLWTATSFDSHNRFTEPNKPITQNTVYHLSKTTGHVLHAWGENQFFMPHGASLAPDGHLWLTDVAMHQVLKYPPTGAEKPIMALGVRMVPGSDIHHFCKPTDVAVDTDGMIYVSDGYCNGRVMKFTPDGTYRKQWGRMATNRELMGSSVPPYAFFIAHNIILCGPGQEELCVADRENGRIQCFTKNGKLTRIIEDKEKTGDRIFAITYSPLDGGVIYGVNGPGLQSPDEAHGFTIQYDTGAVTSQWQPSQDTPLMDPHDISASPSGTDVYVGDLTNKKVFKLYNAQSSASENGVAGAAAVLSQPEDEPQPLNEKIDKKSGPPEGAATLPVDAGKETFEKKSDATHLEKADDSSVDAGKEKSETNLAKQEDVKEFDEGDVNTLTGSTVIIVCLVVLPTITVLTAFACIRMRANRLREYESLLSPNSKSRGGKSLNLGKFLKPAERKGFTRVSSDGSDDEDGDSDVEVYSKKESLPRSQLQASELAT